MTPDFGSVLSHEEFTREATFKAIMVPVEIENSKRSGKSMRVAAQLAKAHGAKLYCLTVANPLGRDFAETPDGYEQEFDDFCAQAAAKLDIEVSPIFKIFDDPKTEITKTAESLGIDLIVMCSHSPRFMDLVFRSNASDVALHFPGSVFIVR